MPPCSWEPHMPRKPRWSHQPAQLPSFQKPSRLPAALNPPRRLLIPGGGAPKRCSAPPVDGHMDGHGEQPGLTPGGGAGRSENLQGGVQRKATGGNRPTGRTPTPGGGAGRSENLQRGQSRLLTMAIHVIIHRSGDSPYISWIASTSFASFMRKRFDDLVKFNAI